MDAPVGHANFVETAGSYPLEPARFPADPDVDCAALHARLRTLLAEFRRSGEIDPFGNPISRTALELTRLVDRGEVSPSALEQLVQHLSAVAFARRARRLAAYVGDTDSAANEARLRDLFVRLARPDPSASPIPFENFRALAETLHFGVVFTAHPTFSLPLELSRELVRLASAPDPAAAAAAPAPWQDVRRARHRPPQGLTLDGEFAWAMEAIGHARDALARLHMVVLDVARALYPDDWTALSPRIVSIATWVGYDLDGRSDIGWTDTLTMRLRVKQAQLLRQRDKAAALHADYPDSAVAPTLELVESVLALAAKQVEFQIEAASATGGDAVERASGFARRLVEGREHALTDTLRTLRLISRAVAAADDPDLALRLCTLRAAIAGHGLALAHTHFRLNASQLHNAIRRQIDLRSAPDDPSHRRTYLAAINDLIAGAEPVSVNLGSLIAERTSARRMFMMIAQLAKHIDGETPVRFLIAETETAFTLLVALYFARLFGVEHLVEISPLFETAEALERGDAVIDEALRSPHFRAYVERHGKLCIQFGFSDSGRYIGQMAATFWIERLRFRLAGVLARHGLTGIQVVLFNTHGESIGRGGHPISMADRLRYLAPPASRAAFGRAGIAVKEESSFQGADGYLHFLSPELAFASLCRIVESALAPADEEVADPIYEDRDFAAEFFAVVRQEFAQVVDDPDYAALLGAFGTNMLDRTGSRPERRQHETWTGPREFGHPSQLRAIPNNGVLQQLGLLANTVSGLGRATAKNPERFRFMRAESPRFRRAMAMAEHAMGLGDLDVLRAYVDTLDPGVWLNRSGRTRIPVRREELRTIARQLERANVHARLVKIFRRLQADYLLLRDQVGDAPSPALDVDAREDLALLHALRIAQIHRIFLLASHIPDFAPHLDLTRDDLLQSILRLDVTETVELLKEIFPRRDSSDVAGVSFAEPATYVGGSSQTYEVEHATIFEPIAAHFELVRRIGAAITHHIGAVG